MKKNTSSDSKFLLYYQRFFNHIYQTSYSNIHAYIAGIIVGFLYHQTRNGRLNLESSRLYNLVKKAFPLMILLGPIPTFLYYEYEIPRPSWPTTLHFVLFHNYGIIFGSLYTLLPESSSVYVLHVSLLRWMINYIPMMVHVSIPNILMLSAATVVASYLLGLVVYLVIEQPTSLLLRHLFFEARRTSKVDCSSPPIMQVEQYLCVVPTDESAILLRYQRSNRSIHSTKGCYKNTFKPRLSSIKQHVLGAAQHLESVASMACRLKHSLLLLLSALNSLQALPSGGKSEYIPLLFEYDNYEKCRQRSPPGVYCFIKSVIEQDVDPINSTRIVVGYRENVLERGVCIVECELELASLNGTERRRLFYPKFDIPYMYTLSTFWKDAIQPSIRRYEQLTNICLNNRLEQKYDMLAYSEIEYCTDNELPESPVLDWWKALFAMCFLSLFGAVLIGNAIDVFGNDRLKKHLFVSSFSIRRNLLQLLQNPKTDLSCDFAYIEGLRVLASFLVLLLHCIVSFAMSPISNPFYLERVLFGPVTRTFKAPLIPIVRLFLTVSGLLLTVHVLEDVRTNSPQLTEISYFWTKLIHRMIRLLPTYYFFLLYAMVADWIPGRDIGIVGFRALTSERLLCRRYGWSNWVLVNNLPFVDGQCMGHGWYVATDLQLFIGGLITLVILWKWPRGTKPVLWSLAGISALLVFCLVYVGGVEPLLADRISDLQYLLISQRYFREVYQPSYTNMGCFVAGLIVGFLYHNVKHNGLNLEQSKIYKTLRLISPPLLIATLSGTHIFYYYEISPQTVWAANFAVSFAYCPVLAFCVFVVKGFQRPAGYFRQLLSSKPMTVLGKLSYSTYMLHPTLLRMLGISDFAPPFPMEWTVGLFFAMWIAVIVGSYLCAAVVYFSLEQPMTLMLRSVYDRWSERTKRKCKVG
ncbi:uncharacterized protein LOC131688247 [Topomyia yanbarensis]|uniref:uncharacterized protein LOC131688247 n=1 Tax=Topomyia yanbarensis TaxID=2498891 RepID=UPI00273B7768|nr:uncharacterized protein LOC131688247 [Topomyia yanbarensis]